MNNNELPKDILEYIKRLEDENARIKQENENIRIENENIRVENENIRVESESIKLESENIRVEYDKVTLELREANITIEKLIAKYENSQERNKLATYNKFVSNSETTKRIEKAVNEVESYLEQGDKPIVKKGRKIGGKNFTSDLTPTRTVYINPNETVCPSCNEKLVKIGEDRTIKLIKLPATYEVVEFISVKTACPKKCDNKIYQEIKNDPFGKSPVTPSVVADIINLKYNLAVPLYRYSKHLNSMGIGTSVYSFAHYMNKAAELLEPLYDKLKYCLTHENIANAIHIDETTLSIVDDKDRENSYVFVYANTYYDKPIYLYDFSVTREVSQTEEILKGFKGTITVDAYPGYNIFKSLGIQLQVCHVHNRRNYYDIIKTLRGNELKSSKAYSIISLLDKIFDEERMYLKNKLTPNEIYAKRNSIEYNQLIEDIRLEVCATNPREGSLLDKAIKYTKNHWADLWTYRKSGYVCPHNNLAERIVSPFVLVRKNCLFSKTYNGAQTTAKLMSIVQTAKANALVVEKYLIYLFENITTSNIDDLLPWSDKLPDNIKMNL